AGLRGLAAAAGEGLPRPGAPPEGGNRPCGKALPGQARAHRPLGVAAVGDLHVGADAPVRVELHLRAQAAVDVAVEVVAVLVAEHGVAFEVLRQRGAHAALDAVAVGIGAAAEVVLVVGDVGDEVGAGADRGVVARADPPLVEVGAGAVERLVGVAAGQVHVRVHRDRAVHAPAVGVAGVGIGADVAALHVVVRQAVGSGRGEGQGGDQGQGGKLGQGGGTLHGGYLSGLVVVVRQADRHGVEAILGARPQRALNTEPVGTGTILVRAGQAAPSKPAWRQASNTVTAIALDRFRLRLC